MISTRRFSYDRSARTASIMATDHEPEPPPAPEAMSWERPVSRPPVLNDQTSALPLWMRPFAKPEVERMAAVRPMALVVARVGAPYAFIVSLVVLALLRVPLRHMLFAVPATTIIGVVLLATIFGLMELVGWLSGYRPALASWTVGGEQSGEALASALARAAKARGFVVAWSKDDTFVATRDLLEGARGLGQRTSEHGPRRLALLSPKRPASTRTLKLAVHGLCLWDGGETAQLAALARDIVSDAAESEPWIARSARWSQP